MNKTVELVERYNYLTATIADLRANRSDLDEPPASELIAVAEKEREAIWVELNEFKLVY